MWRRWVPNQLPTSWLSSRSSSALITKMKPLANWIVVIDETKECHLTQFWILLLDTLPNKVNKLCLPVFQKGADYSRLSRSIHFSYMRYSSSTYTKMGNNFRNNECNSRVHVRNVVHIPAVNGFLERKQLLVVLLRFIGHSDWRYVNHIDVGVWWNRISMKRMKFNCRKKAVINNTNAHVCVLFANALLKVRHCINAREQRYKMTLPEILQILAIWLFCSTWKLYICARMSSV